MREKVSSARLESFMKSIGGAVKRPRIYLGSGEVRLNRRYGEGVARLLMI